MMIFTYFPVCYLPPKNSTRQIDVNTFYDNILANIFEYQDIGTVYIYVVILIVG